MPPATLEAMASDLRCALDPVAFAVERLAFEPDAWQEEVLRATSRRILLNCSRQAGKSTTTAIVGLHTALYRPGALVLLVSPSLRQSRELFKKVVDFLKGIDPRPVLEEDNAMSCVLSNGSRVVSLPGTSPTAWSTGTAVKGTAMKNSLHGQHAGSSEYWRVWADVAVVVGD